MQEIVAVGAGRIAQINDRNVVAVAFGDVAVVTHNIAFGVGREERHSRSAGVFDTGIQPEGGLSDARRTNHQRMDISCIHHSGSMMLAACASHHDSLRQSFLRLFFFLFEKAAFYHSGHSRRFALGRLLAPLLRCKRNVIVDFLYFRFGRPPRRSVLTVADRLGFNVVEVIDVGK